MYQNQTPAMSLNCGKEYPIHTKPVQYEIGTGLTKQFVDTAPKNIDRIVIVDLLQHNKDAELSNHSLGIYMTLEIN